MNFKIQTKLIFLLSFIILVFFIVLLIINNFEQNRTELLFQEQTKSKEQFFDKILNLKQSSLVGYAYDYTYWDEMVQFIYSGDKTWAKQNIDASLSTYKCDAVWIYRPDWKLVYHSHIEKIQIGTDLPLPKSIYPNLFKKSPLINFFIDAPSGLLEVHGASIHPSSDQERKTAAQGYFFACRIWSPIYLQELEELTNSKISLIPITSGKPVKSEKMQKTGTITFIRTLYSWDNRPIMQLVVSSESPIIQILKRASSQETILLFGLAIVLLFILIIFLYRWINSPLRLISQSLALQNPKLISSLQTNTTEFGHIAQLITTFFAQKNELLKEISEHQQTEQQLLETQQRMVDIINFLPDATFAINRESNVIAWNKAIEEMTGIKSENMMGKGNYEYAIPFYSKRRPILIDLFFKNQTATKSLYRNVMKRGNSIIADTFAPNAYLGKGATLWVIASPLYDNQGNIIGAIESIRDITDRKQAEELLRKSEERFKAQYQGNPIPTLTWQRQEDSFELVGYNDAAKEITHGSIEHFIGKTARELYRDREYIAQDMQQCFTEKKVIKRELLSEHFIPGKLLVITYAFVPPDMVMVHMEDITERKQAEAAILEAQQQYTSLVNNLPLGVYRRMLGTQGRFLAANPAILTMFEAESEEILFKQPISSQYVDPNQQKEFDSKIEQNGFVRDEELEMITLTGRRIWVSVTAVMKKDKTGQPYIDGVIRDITDRKVAVQRIFESEERFRVISASAQDAIIMMDNDGNVSYWNPAAEKILGYTKEEIIGKNLHAVLTPQQFHTAHIQAFPEWQKTGKGNAVGKVVELIATRKDKLEIPIELSLSSVKVIDRWHAIGIMRDITDRKRMEEQLRTLSLTDELTGLYNRRGFMTLATQQIRIADRLKQGLTLIYIDLDKMKWINDALGHKEGDCALIDTSNILRTTFRAADIIARIGGDEFVGLALETTGQNSELILNRFQEHLNVYNTMGKRQYTLSLSIGVAQYNPVHPCSIEELLDQGDKLMYEQKRKKGTVRK
ncbi:MAG: PAS domain S-box protein [bacterium]